MAIPFVKKEKKRQREILSKFHSNCFMKDPCVFTGLQESIFR